MVKFKKQIYLKILIEINFIVIAHNKEEIKDKKKKQRKEISKKK